MDTAGELSLAASNGDFERVRELILADTDPNTTCSNFQTPLHWASIIGHLDICKFLCEYGANKDAQNYNGMTPLMLAVSSNHEQLVQYFVTEKVNMHLTNKRGDTVLHVAAKRGHVNMMLLLIQNGADMKRRNHSGQLPEDIVPTTIEREISDWRHALNHAEHIDNIQLTSSAKQNYCKSSKSDSVGSTRSSGIFEGFNDTLSENSHHLQSMELGFSRDLDSAFSRATTPHAMTETGNQHQISCVNDLSVMTQIYLKYNNYIHNDRVKRLLNQWNRHENLKVRLRRMINDEIEEEVKKCQLEHL